MTSLAIGQIWTCRDPRRLGRSLKVMAFDHEYVHAKVVSNSHKVQLFVDAGDKALDQRGRRTKILTRRFSSDCYQLVAPVPTPADSAVARLPQTCMDYGHHNWFPIQILCPQDRRSVVRLVCIQCYGHTQRDSPCLPDAVFPGGLAA
ncbi:hypothetical protein [Streptomyces sp. UNOC14_S4]|uniref:hypothetical protein n=1 Tax=Streptomyces sp. UNOC14_S4 TaxID=2872340 RepID=UPI001E412D14|nr:hypothetical protein [Streptomyces sp. UNOC14_S4]MCC3766017.1 hypothetical protein [Streptomyces sp. UNOC14_S4]